MTNKNNAHVVIHHSQHDTSTLKNFIEEKGFEIIEGHVFAEIKAKLIGKEIFAVFGVVDAKDSSCIDFMRSMLEFKRNTQRVILSNTFDETILKKVVNRAHIDYLISFPVDENELENYFRKIPRRYKKLNKPFEKFEVLTEVTEDLLNQNEKFREQATSDALTKLLNRRSFDCMTKRFWNNKLKKDVSFCMALLDLDFFKRVNDTYGHMAGDDVLRTVASILNNNQRAGIDFAFRYGGEEFAVISSATTLAEMELYILRLHNIIRNYVIDIGNNEKLKVTISAGICSSDAADSLEKLIEQADESLYKAKQSGRDRVVLYEPQVEIA
jgi:diguanylate cyclase (GGDEF)-like protein